MKRIVILADTHSGHQLGLTPPEYQGGLFEGVQREFWDWFEGEARKVKEEGPVDLLVLNGDALEGRGPKSGSRELLSVDRAVQIEMASEIIGLFEAERVILIGGTPYHIGITEDWEQVLAWSCGYEFYYARQLDIEGVIFDFKHHSGNSSIPHGRGTPLLKNKVWTDLMAVRDREINGSKYPNCTVRSHTHFYLAIEDRDSCIISTPCLQLGSRYGETLCQGQVDVGFLSFTVRGKRDFPFTCHLLELNPTATPPVKI